ALNFEHVMKRAKKTSLDLNHCHDDVCLTGSLPQHVLLHNVHRRLHKVFDFISYMVSQRMQQDKEKAVPERVQFLTFSVASLACDVFHHDAIAGRAFELPCEIINEPVNEEFTSLHQAASLLCSYRVEDF